MISFPICIRCARMRPPTTKLTCDAFPDGIPEEILDANIEHTAPYSGDHGIQFTPIKEEHKQNFRCKAGTVDEGYSCPTNEPTPQSSHISANLDDISKLKTTAEIQDYANKTFPNTKFDLSASLPVVSKDGGTVTIECHPDIAKSLVSQFSKLSEEFPAVANEIKQFQIKMLDTKTWASTGAEVKFSGPAERHIYFNAVYASNPEMFEKGLKDSAEQGFHPKGCDTVESVMSHEFGHCVYEHYKDAYRQTLIPYIQKTGYAQYGFGTVSGTVAAWNKEQSCRGLSDYAKPTVKAWGQDTDRDERWAEAFSSLQHTPENEQAKIVKNMGKLLDRIKDESKWMPIAGATYPHTSYEMQSRTGPDEQDLKAAEAFKALRVDIGLKPEKAQRGKKR